MIINFIIGGLFEKFELISHLIDIYKDERYKFNPYVNITAVYGSNKTIWGGGRFIGTHTEDEYKVAEYMEHHKDISPCFVFSNLLLSTKDLEDKDGLKILDAFRNIDNVKFIIGCNVMLNYLNSIGYTKNNYISSMTKVLNKTELSTEFEKYRYVVLNEDLNIDYNYLFNLPIKYKDKVELLVNSSCGISCKYRKEHYISYSKDCLRIRKHIPHNCKLSTNPSGPLFKIMKNPLFIPKERIPFYVKNGITNFKIQGRTGYDFDYIETLVYYLIKPEYQLEIRQRLSLGENLCI